jgi:hypothetical protein
MRFFRKKLSKIFGWRPSSRAPATPSGLLAHAGFRRCVGDWPAAGRDLDEVEEIAELGRCGEGIQPLDDENGRR